MSHSLKKRASNERVSSNDYTSEGLPQNGATHPSGLSPYSRIPNGQHQPRSIPEETYAPPTRDTALREYTNPSSSHAPNGHHTAPRAANGYGSRYYPPPPPPRQASTTNNTWSHYPTHPSNSPPRARIPLNPSLSPTNSPTSYHFGTGARSDSPPASTYFAAVPSSQHRMAPTPGHAQDLGEHFSFSTTLRRHSLGPAQDLHGLPLPFSGSGERGGESNSVLDNLQAFALLAKARVEKIIFPGREDDALNGTENGFAPRDRDGADGASSYTMQERPDTVSAQYAPMPVKEVLEYFRTDPKTGLSESTAAALREHHGFNEFSVAPKASMIRKFIETIYESPLNLLLLGSAAISMVMGNIDDAVSITLAILIVLAVGFVQERRSEQSLEALNRLVPHHCHLLRDSHQKTVLANNLLPGDIVSFTVGDRIPADVRLITALDLDVDESSLTGEAEVVRKTAEPCAFGAPLGDRTSMTFMGTLVRNGRGEGIVVSIGEQTEFGAIFATMQDIEEKRTPLQASMDELGSKLSQLSFAIIGVICIVGVLQSKSWLDMFTIGVSLAVAAIPEGLPIVTTVTLALGVLRMARKNAIVKKLPSVEALGCVSVICCDKTGTLTKNEQTVTEIYTVDDLVKLDPPPLPERRSAALLKTAQVGAICNNARLNEEGIHVGQSTDVALLNVLSVLDLGPQKSNFAISEERPFSSDTKSMAVSGTHGSDSRQIYYVKGALETILPRCKAYYVSDDSSPSLDTLTRSLIVSKAEAVASRGLRVVAMAYAFGTVSNVEGESGSGTGASAALGLGTSRAGSPLAQANLIFTGFQAMMDPPRKGVADAIASLQEGGVQVVMITGDAVETAMAIGRQLGLLVPGRSNSLYAPTPNGDHASKSASHRGCLTGKELDAMDDRMLRERVAGISVFARTTPRHKMRIVGALQARGAVVGMTGDGVNDAPALKMADIGVAMGSGTDVAKEAADVILVDDNFSTILSAVEEGKTIFHNIQHFLAFQLSTAVSALALISLTTVLGMSNPLNAMQILFINIIMDGPPSQSLGVDPADRAVMKKPPRAKTAPIIDSRVIFRVLFSASVMVLLTLFVYLHELSDGRISRRDQTMTFTCFVFLDLAAAIQNRGLGCGLTQNKMLVTTVSTSFFVQLGLIYLPFMQSVFQTEALSFRDLFTLLVLGCIALGLHEGRRRYERQKEREGGWDRAESVA